MPVFHAGRVPIQVFFRGHSGRGGPDTASRGIRSADLSGPCAHGFILSIAPRAYYRPGLPIFASLSSPGWWVARPTIALGLGLQEHASGGPMPLLRCGVPRATASFGIRVAAAKSRRPGEMHRKRRRAAATACMAAFAFWFRVMVGALDAQGDSHSPRG